MLELPRFIEVLRTSSSTPRVVHNHEHGLVCGVFWCLRAEWVAGQKLAEPPLIIALAAEAEIRCKACVSETDMFSLMGPVRIGRAHTLPTAVAVLITQQAELNDFKF